MNALYGNIFEVLKCVILCLTYIYGEKTRVAVRTVFQTIPRLRIPCGFDSTQVRSSDNWIQQ